jgi:hypothetical protein
MRRLPCLTAFALLVAAAPASADGLKVDKIGGFWSTNQTRLQWNAVVLDTTLGGPSMRSWAGPAPLAASLYGDFYFSKDLADPMLPRSGFRASSALLIRQPGVSLSELAWSSRSMSSFAAPSRLSLGGYGAAGFDLSGQGVDALPYLGIGYSDHSLKSGWGFWADIGLVVQSPGSALGLGRTLSGAQGYEDLLRQMQLSPMLQLGVNYSF